MKLIIFLSIALFSFSTVYANEIIVSSTRCDVGRFKSLLWEGQQYSYSGIRYVTVYNLQSLKLASYLEFSNVYDYASKSYLPERVVRLERGKLDLGWLYGVIQKQSATEAFKDSLKSCAQNYSGQFAGSAYSDLFRSLIRRHF